MFAKQPHAQTPRTCVLDHLTDQNVCVQIQMISTLKSAILVSMLLNSAIPIVCANGLNRLLRFEPQRFAKRHHC